MQIQVGQTVYLRPLCNAARYSKEIKSGVVSKVGNKYFELEGWPRSRFYKETLLEDGRGYSSDWQAYLSMQEIQEEDEINNIITSMRKLFDVYGKINLSLDQLREIQKIAARNEDHGTFYNSAMPKCKCGAESVYHYCKTCWHYEIDSQNQAALEAYHESKLQING